LKRRKAAASRKAKARRTVVTTKSVRTTVANPRMIFPRSSRGTTERITRLARQKSKALARLQRLRGPARTARRHAVIEQLGQLDREIGRLRQYREAQWYRGNPVHKSLARTDLYRTQEIPTFKAKLPRTSPNRHARKRMARAAAASPKQFENPGRLSPRRKKPRRKVASMARRKKSGARKARGRRTAAQRSAFKRMIAGLRRWKKGIGRKKRRNPSKSRRRVARRRKGARNMPTALLINPRRSRRRRALARSRRSNPPMARKRRKRIHGRRRRRNPGGNIKAAVVQTVKTAVPALATGAALGFLDTKVLGGKKPIIGILAKVGIGAASALLLRNRPGLACSVAGACFGTLGYSTGVKFAGGVAAVAGPVAMKEAAKVAAEDQAALGVLAQELQGLGVLQIEGMGGTEPLDVEAAFAGSEDGTY
jgi:hypothetical protein